jgi:hypothetical protein
MVAVTFVLLIAAPTSQPPGPRRGRICELAVRSALAPRGPGSSADAHRIADPAAAGGASGSCSIAGIRWFASRSRSDFRGWKAGARHPGPDHGFVDVAAG